MALGNILAEIMSGLRDRPEDPIEEMKKKILMAQAGGPSATDASPSPVPTPTPRPDPALKPPIPPDAQPPTPPTPPTPPNVLEQPVSDAYKSPPDIVELYKMQMDQVEKMRSEQNRSDALTMIAAGLTPHEEVRLGLLRTLGEGSGGDGTSGSTAMFTAMEKLREAQQKEMTAQRMRAMLPQLSKQYGVSMEAMEAMLSGGTLEEFLKEASKPDNEVITNPDGSQTLRSKKDGHIVAEVGAKAPRKTKMITMPDQTQVEVYEDDNTRVDTGERIGNLGVPTKITYEDAPRGGKYALDPNGKRLPDKDIPGEDELVVEKNAEGQFQVFNKSTGQPFGKPYGPRTDVSTEDMKNYAQERMAAEGRGEPFEDFDIWRKKRDILKSPQGGANWDPRSGTTLPPPEPGKQWKHDKNGNVMTDENGAYIQVTTPGTKQAEEEKTATNAANQKKAQKLLASSILVNDSDKALQIAEANKESFWKSTTGFMGAISSNIPNTPAHDVFQLLQSVKAQIGFDKLQQMRDASPTGAALGPVSDFENRLLQATYGSLEQSQSHELFVHNVGRVKKIYEAIVNGGFGSGTIEEINANPLAKEMGISVSPDGQVKIDPPKITKRKTADEIIEESKKRRANQGGQN